MHARDVAALGKAVAHHAAAGAAGELDQMRVLAADDDDAVLAHEAHELGEGGLDLLDARVVVEMVGLDVGDHDHVGVEVKEGAVGLVGLGHEVLPRAVAAVGVVALNDAADQEARVEPHAVEHGGAHGRGGRLAVRARDGHGGVATPERGEHLGARPHGDAELAGADELWVGLGDGRGDDHDVGLDRVDRGGLVTDVNVDARAGELAAVTRGLEVGAAHAVAALVKHEGDAAHAGPADADEMRALEFEGSRSGRRFSHAQTSIRQMGAKTG